MRDSRYVGDVDDLVLVQPINGYTIQLVAGRTSGDIHEFCSFSGKVRL